MNNNRLGNKEEKFDNDTINSSSFSNEPYFFSVSNFKLVLMSICTFGIYELYWFYKNWELIKKRWAQNIMPFWRAFFAPIWAYSCFEEIKNSAIQNRLSYSLPTVFLAIGYFIIQALWRLPDPYWLLSFLSFVFIIPANNVALRVNEGVNPSFENNSSFSGTNITAIVIGGLLFVLGLLETLMPSV
ncbi:hypothetical protein [Gracilimonas sp. BCB1]|uniref:hypothetical protein n=1 Tax=Gracilimonas sp. BCB1 TaxID=3152362 RepID=UPI0032D9373D